MTQIPFHRGIDQIFRRDSGWKTITPVKLETLKLLQELGVERVHVIEEGDFTMRELLGGS